MEWYSKEKSLTDPKFFVLDDLNFLRSGTIVFGKKVYEWMKAAVTNVILEKSGTGAHRFFVTEDGFAVFHSYFGAPAAVVLAETLIASGVKRLIIFGEAGAISPKIGLGEVLIPAFAIREEGTSYHYLPPDVLAKPSREVREEIKELLSELGVSYKEGGVWTTDAIFRETRDKVLKYSSQGVLAVEMECSALFSVARFRGVDAAALLIITDELHGEEWRTAFREAKVMENEKKISEILAKKWLKLALENKSNN